MTMEFETTQSKDQHTRSRTSRRLVAGLGAAMLVAAAGGVGFGIGRNVDRDDQVNSAASADDTSPPSATEAPAVTVPSTDVPAPNETAAPAEEPADQPASTSPALDSVVEGSPALETAEGGAIASSGGGGWAVFGADEMELLFERTTDDGISIRAQLGQLWPTEQYGAYDPTGWQPPGWCFQSGEARVAISGGGIIDVGSVGWYSEPYQGRSVSWLTLGRVDGNAHRLIFTQVPEGTTSVTATFGDGSIDVTTPQNGVAVLIVPGAPETIVHDEDVEYGGWIEEVPDFAISFGGTGSGATVTHDQVGTWNDPAFVASCSPPPPALPDPGEQPADPGESEAEIVAAMSSVYGGTADGESSLDLLDDSTGVEEAREQVRAGGFETEASNAEVVVEELVFTTPTEAWFRYRIETGGIGLNERYGIAIRVDGVWLITRATLCQDLSMAGGSCGGDVGTIRPPGFEFEEFDFDEQSIVD